jgi:16S rRNA (adenine1518-N6/adenine1519-N6)-dimethyltransferase
MEMEYDGANIKQLRSALLEFSLSPNKRLGQNFLCDANIADAIVQAAGDLAGAHVLEIGPGSGALTVRLLQKARHVTAVELDAGLCRLLSDRIQSVDFTLIHADALKIPIDDLNAGEATVLVANLPYYVTTPLIMRYLAECPNISRFVLMMQKEVAARLVAKPNSQNYGSFSVAVQYYALSRQSLSVSANCFFPAPKVSSAVVVLSRRCPPIKPMDETLFFQAVQVCFAMRRKTIRNNLLAIPNLGKEGVEKSLANCRIDGQARGETLSVEQFVELSNAIGEALKQ